MRGFDDLPPAIRSEIASRLHAFEPDLARFFALPSVTVSGRELEALMTAAFLAGYGNAAGDIAESRGPYPKLSGLGKMIEDARGSLL